MIRFILDHVAAALTRVTQQFKGKARFEALVSTFSEQVQGLEDAFNKLYSDRWLTTAIGLQLDNLGTVVGESRVGRDDEDYRTAIKARIAANVCNGTPDEILRVLSLYDAPVYKLTELFPAKLELYRTIALVTDPAILLRVLQSIKSCGVGVGLHYALVDSDNVFTFASGDVEEDSTTQGFSDDLETTGGFWSDVVS